MGITMERSWEQRVNDFAGCNVAGRLRRVRELIVAKHNDMAVEELDAVMDYVTDTPKGELDTPRKPGR